MCHCSLRCNYLNYHAGLPTKILQRGNSGVSYLAMGYQLPLGWG